MIRTHEAPIVGNWYIGPEHEKFEIVAVDNKEKTIEIQYFTGEIEEWDMDTWYGIPISAIAAPKDWSAPFEVDKDEFPELSDKAQHLDYWVKPIDQIQN